jgi:hypothetical protein
VGLNQKFLGAIILIRNRVSPLLFWSRYTALKYRLGVSWKIDMRVLTIRG